MSVNCEHWRDCGVIGGGCCAIKKFNRPSFGTCNIACLGLRMERPSEPEVKPIPRADWPPLIKAAAKLSKNTDKGIGDTLHRMFGGDVTTELIKKLTGKTCGCSARVAWLNARYPL